MSNKPRPVGNWVSREGCTSGKQRGSVVMHREGESSERKSKGELRARLPRDVVGRR